MSIIFEVQRLEKSIGGKKIVDGLSFACNEGEIFGFLGPNGAGKTTTLKMALGLMRPDSGKVSIGGHDISKEFEKAMACVGAVVESPALYGNLSAEQNLRLFGRMREGVTGERISEALSLVGLSSGKTKVREYSLGMRQKLGIAQAILHRPKLLLLDEPTNGIDPMGIRELRDVLKHLAHEEGVCVVLSSHLMSEVELMCDRVCVIDRGRLVQIKTLREMIETIRPDGNEEIVFRFVVSPLWKAKKLLDERPAGRIAASTEEYIDISLTTSALAELNRRFVENGVALHTVAPVNPRNLEDAFIEMTGGGGRNG